MDLQSLAITNYDDYVYTINNTPTNGWARYLLLMSDFAQVGWSGVPVARDVALSRINAIQFKFGSEITNESEDLYVDDVAIFGGNVTYASNVIYRQQNTLSMEGGSNWLVNGTFIGPNAPGWTMASAPIVTNENWGNWMMVFEHYNGTTTSGGDCYQTVTSGIAVGNSYKLDVDVQKSATTYTGRAYMNLVWLTSSNTTVQTDSTNITALIVTNWFTTVSTGWKVAPTGAVKVRVDLASTNSTVPPYTDNAVKFENAVFSGSALPDNGWITTWTNGFVTSYTTNCAEGTKAIQLSCTNSTPGYLAGFLVAPYGQGQTMTSFTNYTGIALRARRAPLFASTGVTNARIRISVCVGTNTTPTAKYRWQPIDASAWEDYIIFSKDKFYTAATVDNTDPTTWVPWTDTWTNIGQITIEYGPQAGGADPYDLLLDDYRPCSGTYLH